MRSPDAAPRARVVVSTAGGVEGEQWGSACGPGPRVDSGTALAYVSRVSAAQFRVRVVENRDLGGSYFVLACESHAPNPVADARPGQFVMLRGDWGRDLINGRPFSVLEAIDERRFTILAKVFGRGTALMHAMEPGEEMTCTGVLGSSFPEPGDGVQLLVAGGVGLPPMMFQAREAARRGNSAAVEMFYGGRGTPDLVLLDEIRDMGVAMTLATEDGSVGVRGRVTEPFVARLDELRAAGTPVTALACGPTPMLEAVRTIGLERAVPTFVSLEERMACGIGVCLGCAVPVYGPRPYEYCCDQGPVYDARKVRW